MPLSTFQIPQKTKSAFLLWSLWPGLARVCSSGWERGLRPCAYGRSMLESMLRQGRGSFALAFNLETYLGIISRLQKFGLVRENSSALLPS